MPYLLYSVIDTSIISPLVMKVKEGTDEERGFTGAFAREAPLS